MGVGRSQALGLGSNIWARQCKASAAAASAGQSCNAEATKTSLVMREVKPCVPGLGAIRHATAVLLHHHEHSAQHHRRVCHLICPVTIDFILLTRTFIPCCQECCQQGWQNDGTATTCRSSNHGARSLHPSLFVLLTESQCLCFCYTCHQGQVSIVT